MRFFGALRSRVSHYSPQTGFRSLPSTLPINLRQVSANQPGWVSVGLRGISSFREIPGIPDRVVDHLSASGITRVNCINSLYSRPVSPLLKSVPEFVSAYSSFTVMRMILPAYTDSRPKSQDNSKQTDLLCVCTHGYRKDNFFPCSHIFDAFITFKDPAEVSPSPSSPYPCSIGHSLHAAPC